MICIGPDGYANLAAPPNVLPAFMAHHVGCTAANMYASMPNGMEPTSLSSTVSDHGVIGQLQSMLSREYDLMQHQQRYKENNMGLSSPSLIGSCMNEAAGAARLPLAPKMNKPKLNRDPVKERKRKDVHNMIERKRRYNINDRIKELSGFLPKNWTNQMKLNKGSILRATVEYLKYIDCERRKWARLRQRHRKLADENRRLRAESSSKNIGDLAACQNMGANGDDIRVIQSLSTAGMMVSNAAVGRVPTIVPIEAIDYMFGNTVGSTISQGSSSTPNIYRRNGGSGRLSRPLLSDDSGSDTENMASIEARAVAMLKDEALSVNDEENDAMTDVDDDDLLISSDDHGMQEGVMSPDFDDDDDVLLRVPVSITTSVDSSRAVTITNYHYPLSVVTRKEMQINM